MIFHVDGNSFYASCERLFRPDLYGKPIAVLSNNDGIIIALNQECKDAGFHRGDVFFKVKAELAQAGVTVFSSNYTLYADISSRLNLVYCTLCPEVEIYSIDESFLYFPDWKTADLVEIGWQLRALAGTEVGVPVSVGIAPTKTLAKMCNKLAKKRGGLCCWAEMDGDAELQKYPVGDLWGIGNAKTRLLSRHGVRTALDLKNYPLHHAKKHLTIMGYRTVQELNGIPAIDRVEREKRQNICSSKSFAQAVTGLDELKAALSEYTQEAVKRMREEASACRYVSVFLMTNPYSDIGEQYFNSAQAELPSPSSFLPDILGTALALLSQLYREGYRYRKVMINLLGLEDDRTAQQDLFASNTDKVKHDALMAAFDEVNDRYGRGALHLGVRGNTAETGKNPPDKSGKSSPETVSRAGGAESGWQMKRNYLSPEYTTRFEDVPGVR